MNTTVVGDKRVKATNDNNETYSKELTNQIIFVNNIYKDLFKIQLSCSIHKAELEAHNMILLLEPGIASPGSLTSIRNCAGHLCEKLSQPATFN